MTSLPRIFVLLVSTFGIACAGGDAATPAPADSGTAACGEPASCPAADADVKPVISCMTPDTTNVNEAFTLHIYGTHLQDSRGANSKVAFDGLTGIEGIPASACHLTLAIPAGYFTTAKAVDVVVATAAQSDPAKLTVR